MNYRDYFKQESVVPNTGSFFNRVLSDQKKQKEYEWEKLLNDIFIPEQTTDLTSTQSYQKPVEHNPIDFSKYLPNKTSNNTFFNNIIFKQGVSHEGLKDSMIGLLELMASKGYKVRVTAGYETTGHLPNSRHGHGTAIDITPVNTNDPAAWDELDNILDADPDIIRYMVDNGLGFLKEEKGTTPYSTGKHRHVGDDSRLSSSYKIRHSV